MLSQFPLKFLPQAPATINLSSDPTNRRVWMQQFFGAIHHDSFRGSKPRDRLSSISRALGQRQNALSLRAVVERMKAPNFVETTNGIESVEITRVACGELARF
jgi:hypothetical protein